MLQSGKHNICRINLRKCTWEELRLDIPSPSWMSWWHRLICFVNDSRRLTVPPLSTQKLSRLCLLYAFCLPKSPITRTRLWVQSTLVPCWERLWWMTWPLLYKRVWVRGIVQHHRELQYTFPQGLFVLGCQPTVWPQVSRISMYYFVPLPLSALFWMLYSHPFVVS